LVLLEVIFPPAKEALENFGHSAAKGLASPDLDGLGPVIVFTIAMEERK